MEFRALRPNEYQQVSDVFETAFLVQREVKTTPQEPDTESGRAARGAFDETGRMVSCVIGVPFRAMYEGTFVGMTGIGGVSSLPETRRGGHIRELLRLILRESYERGDVLSALYPFSHTYYRQFGYEQCVRATACEIPLNALEAYPRPAQVRQVFPGDDIAPLEAVYARFIQGRNLACERVSAHMGGKSIWQRRMSRDPYTTRWYTYLIRDEHGEPEAYITLNPEKHGDETWMNARDFAWTSPAAMRRMLGFCYMLTGQVTTLLWNAPDDIDPFALLPEPYDIQVNIKPAGMARVVNVREALRLRKTPQPYTLCVTDPMLPENNGAFRVSSDGETSVVVPLENDAPVDLDTSIQTFSLLALGTLSIDTALYMRDDLNAHGNLDALRAAYPSGHIYLAEYF